MRKTLLFTLCCCTYLIAAATRPFLFIENKGQVRSFTGTTIPSVKFLLEDGMVSVAIGKDFIHYSFKEPIAGDATKVRACGWDMHLAGADKNAVIIGTEWQSYSEQHYLNGLGAAPVSGIHSYKKLVCKNVYPNIDWVIYVSGKKLKYDFIVHPGGKVSDIQLRYEGATTSLNKDGSLSIKGQMGSIIEDAPFAYDAITKQKVECRFKLKNNTAGFEVAAISNPLVIDPALIWSTYYGGSGQEWPNAISVTENSEVYIAGYTYSSSQVTTPGSFQPTMYSVQQCMYLSKFDSSGQLAWGTYYSGSTGFIIDQIGAAVADGLGNIYIAGSTQNTGVSSASITTAGCHQSNYGGGYTDGFIAKFNSTGQRIWSTYYGGDSVEIICALAVDQSNNLYAAGWSASQNGLTTPNGYQPFVPANDTNSFIVKFNPGGTRIWGTYFGGSGRDHINDIAIDANDNLFFGGMTHSLSNIATNGSFQQTSGGNREGFLGKLNASGALQWCTYVGSTGLDHVSSVSTNLSGVVYVSGGTTSTTNMTTAGAYQTTFGGGNDDAFLAKYNASGNRVWSTYIGGTGAEYIGGGLAPLANINTRTSLSCSKDGYLYLTGSTNSTTTIATPGAWQQTLTGGPVDAFVMQFAPNGTKLWGGYLGGNQTDYGLVIGNDHQGRVYTAGVSRSATMIATPGAYQTTINNNGSTALYDVMLTRWKDSSLPAKVQLVLPIEPVCAGTAFSVGYVVVGSGFYTGNEFTVQLSNALGSFATPLDIGSTFSTTSGTITCFAPSNYSGLYRLRIITSMLYRVSDTTYIDIFPTPAPVITKQGNTLSTSVYATYQWYLNNVPIAGATNQTYIATQNGNYKVEVVNANGCKGMSASMQVHIVNSVAEQEVLPVHIYPNPATEKVFIDCPLAFECTITDMQGRILLRSSEPNIDIGKFAKAMYVLSVQVEGKMVLKQKLVKLE